MARLTAGMRKKGSGYESRFYVNGKRYSVSGKTVSECREKEAKRRRELEEGAYKPERELTISEYFERWTEAKQDSVRETTIRTQRILFNAMAEVQIDTVGHTFGNVKISEIENSMIMVVRTSLRKEHTVTVKGKTITRKARTTRTTNDSISLLKSVFQSAINERIITWNPASGIKALKRVEELARNTTHRALTIKETKHFLDVAKERNSAYYNLYVFLLHTGCRIGEAGALLPGDFDNVGVRIGRTVTRTEIGGYMIGSETKTAAGRRFIPLDKAAKDAVKAQKHFNMALYGVDMSRPIFQTAHGALLKSTNVNQDIDRICRAAGIERFTVHAFRDTFATRCVESGMQPKVLQDIMGHSDINMTMNLYAHSMDDSKILQLKVVNFG